VPVNVKPPHISGQPRVGQTLTCSKGSWSNHPTHFAYRWGRNGKAIQGATNSSYKVQPADKGHALACSVVAQNKRGTSRPASSKSVHVT
jgi:hypothetical protein